jgi:hypothetical protein
VLLHGRETSSLERFVEGLGGTLRLARGFPGEGRVVHGGAVWNQLVGLVERGGGPERVAMSESPLALAEPAGGFVETIVGDGWGSDQERSQEGSEERGSNHGSGSYRKRPLFGKRYVSRHFP